MLDPVPSVTTLWPATRGEKGNGGSASGKEVSKGKILVKIKCSMGWY
jgi:head-tail adaptor